MQHDGRRRVRLPVLRNIKGVTIADGQLALVESQG